MEEQLRQLAQSADKSGDGLDIEEISKLLFAINLNVSKSTIKKQFKLVKPNADTMNVNEFMTMFRNMEGASNFCQDLFKSLSNGSGLLKSSEVIIKT
jgi:hypothetical protein